MSLATQVVNRLWDRRGEFRSSQFLTAFDRMRPSGRRRFIQSLTRNVRCRLLTDAKDIDFVKQRD